MSKYLDKHYHINNSEARRITGISDTLKMSRLLKSWVSKGLLEVVGGGFKGNMYYRKPGVEMPSGLPFSRGVENERHSICLRSR